MKLLFTGIVSAWLLVPLFLGLSALTVLLYRRHALPKPWSYWLPASRITVLALLILTLFQPVLAHIYTVTERGRIPILVDTSGSMSLVDDYSPARQIEIGWQLKLYDRKLRNMVFRKEEERWSDIDRMLTEITKTGEELGEKLRAEVPWTPEFGKEVASFAGQLDEVHDELLDQGKTLRESVEKSEYLDLARDAGSVSWKRYDEVAGGRVGDLKKSPKFPGEPDFYGTLENLEIPADQADSYGGVVCGYLLAPASGTYLFTILADEEGELFLSEDDFPGRTNRIAGAYRTTATSSEVKLKEGKVYYIEVLYKEHDGPDRMVVGWKRPDGKTQTPIPGAHLAPYGLPGVTAPFRTEFIEFAENVVGMGETIGELAKTLEDMDDKEAKQHDEALGVVEKLAGMPARFHATEGALERLQLLADERLAFSGIEEIDEARETIDSMKREDMVEYLLTKRPFRLVTRLQKRGDAEVFSLQEKPEVVDANDYTNLAGELASTRLGSTIQAVLGRYEKSRVAGVVLLTDGNVNAGRPVNEAREELRERGIPVFTLAVGSPVPPPDVAIAWVIAPRTSFVDDNLRLSVVLKRDGYQEREIKVKVSSGDEILREKTVEPGEETRIVVDLSFVEKTGGVRDYTVEAEGFDEEAFDHNNRKGFTVSLLKDRIRTLVVDEFPRWETRYLGMMLSRDKRVDLRTIFVASTEDEELPVGEKGYPETRDELMGYHIIVLGDVAPRHFSDEQLEHLRDFVLERGGTLILLCGEHYMPSRYGDTPVGEIIPLKRTGTAREPVHRSRLFPDENAEEDAGAIYPLGLTEPARFEDVMQIGATPDLSEELWKKLPPMNWVQEGAVVSKTADLLVLAERSTRDRRTRHGRRESPAVAKAYVGLGKVLYLGTDSFWRWRYRSRWTYHHRFWGQVLLWATMGRTTGDDPNVKLMVDRFAYAPEESVVIKARILDANKDPLNETDATLELFDEAEELVKRVPLVYLADSGGEYRAELKDLARGKYKVVPRVPEITEREIEAEAEFEIRDLPTSEYIDLALNEAQIEEFSDTHVPFEHALEILEDVPRIESEEEHRDDTELWDTWPYLLLVGILLGFEWQARKRLKLV